MNIDMNRTGDISDYDSDDCKGPYERGYHYGKAEREREVAALKDDLKQAHVACAAWRGLGELMMAKAHMYVSERDGSPNTFPGQIIGLLDDMLSQADPGQPVLDNLAAKNAEIDQLKRERDQLRGRLDTLEAIIDDDGPDSPLVQALKASGVKPLTVIVAGAFDAYRKAIKIAFNETSNISVHYYEICSGWDEGGDIAVVTTKDPDEHGCVLLTWAEYGEGFRRNYRHLRGSTNYHRDYDVTGANDRVVLYPETMDCQDPHIKQLLAKEK